MMRHTYFTGARRAAQSFLRWERVEAGSVALFYSLGDDSSLADIQAAGVVWVSPLLPARPLDTLMKATWNRKEPRHVGDGCTFLTMRESLDSLRIESRKVIRSVGVGFYIRY